jgi:hypothetical protein
MSASLSLVPQLSQLTVKVSRLSESLKASVLQVFMNARLLDGRESAGDDRVERNSTKQSHHEQTKGGSLLEYLFSEFQRAGCFFAGKDVVLASSGFELAQVLDCDSVQQSRLSAEDLSKALILCEASLAQALEIERAVSSPSLSPQVSRGNNYVTEVLTCVTENWLNSRLRLPQRKFWLSENSQEKLKPNLQELNFASNLSPVGILVLDQFAGNFLTAHFFCLPYKSTPQGVEIFGSPIILTSLKKFNQKGGGSRLQIEQVVKGNNSEITLDISLSTASFMQGEALLSVSAKNLRDRLKDKVEAFAVGSKTVNSDTLAVACMDALLLLFYCVYDYSIKSPTMVFSLTR